MYNGQFGMKMMKVHLLGNSDLNSKVAWRGCTLMAIIAPANDHHYLLSALLRNLRRFTNYERCCCDFGSAVNLKPSQSVSIEHQ